MAIIRGIYIHTSGICFYGLKPPRYLQQENTCRDYAMGVAPIPQGNWKKLLKTNLIRHSLKWHIFVKRVGGRRISISSVNKFSIF